ncbi:HBR242Cp [Eremothecium sinecaudum]|uniref:HBR242Cp n=1 Tax=Eremothecium sinecaudum TaxID=45286 RepID=A0A109UX28_9SACH|nr:HBR242Cp [Eremothecium sinecaudum]AMD19143.1 HBR242Cp [Eremothecium sinecaudum]
MRVPRINRIINYRQFSAKVGFVFDIDGVLLQGRTPIPGASEALKLLQKERIPFILLTNGGGILESAKAAFLSSVLEVDLSPSQLIQGHTLYKTLTSDYKKILAVGPPSVREVAESYGFEDVVHALDILHYNRKISPFATTCLEQIATDGKDNPNLDKTPFDAILVFTDSYDWGTDIQIISDILNSDGGMLNTKRDYSSTTPSVPIWFSANDLFWSNGYQLNRFAQGMFRVVNDRVYQELNGGCSLHDNLVGKPTSATFNYASHVLNHWDDIMNGTSPTQTVDPKLGIPPSSNKFKKVYMIGDNPYTDIIGAKTFGWETCLVRTGVYSPQDKLPCNPTMVVDSVLDAVKAALAEH